ncbi:putative ABC transport system permease protein [Kribbella sp. VKM Ac-2527]|uniref:Putative ABC transport system permease protein n=1 Tax=Kribbella caucasensis TaxID=2512215 RepID=A0A4R6KSM3_9ACTN|nr:ABC transporter permease [Kribbella sp. VKM Ac-2527]TDO54833.1 putative ABC transport system permease protein [Kribbella sp. VKM Ac-2527]
MVNPQTGLPDPAGGPSTSPSTSPPARRRLLARLRLGLAELVLRVGRPSRRGRLTRGPGLRRGSAVRLRRGPAVRDLLDEALAGVAARPTRLILTTLGTVLGIAALVGTLGLGQTAAGQITQRFDLAAATRVVVQPEDKGGQEGEAATQLPWDAPDRLARLNGVDAAGTVSALDIGDDMVRSVEGLDGQKTGYALPVLAGSAGLFDAVRASLKTGRFFDAGHDRRGDRVVVLGKHAAEKLGINRVDSQPAVFIGDQAYTVVGILDAVSGRAELLDGVIMPNGAAKTEFDLESPDAVEIRTQVGAAQLIAGQAPVAIEPNNPSAIKVDAPPVQGGVRRGVESDLNALFLLLGAVALLVGGLGIANVTLLSVLERISEIGLRRALGAARRHVAVQFLVESVIVGFLGGLLGTAVGVLLTIGVSWGRDWTPILDNRLAIGSPLLGALIGLIAGTYPAWKASAIEPITALRGT